MEAEAAKAVQEIVAAIKSGSGPLVERLIDEYVRRSILAAIFAALIAFLCFFGVFAATRRVCKNDYPEHTAIRTGFLLVAGLIASVVAAQEVLDAVAPVYGLVSSILR